MNPQDTLLTARQVRGRYGNVSDMCIWRWLRDEKLGFPQPLTINRRRFWRVRDLEQFEASQTQREAANG